jgi:RND family efflux transporter MFP subunit
MRGLRIAAVLGLGLLLAGSGGCASDQLAPRSKQRAIPVETAKVEQGDVSDARTFTGTLEAFAQLSIAPKIAGRVEQVAVDLGDAVPEGQLLVTLENDELRQAMRLGQAAVTISNAAQLENESVLSTAQRELERIETLHEQGLVSEAALDAARTAERAATAAFERARGELARARAELATARIRLGYAEIRAGPLEGGGSRVVAARHVDPGNAVAANDELLTTVEIDPLIAAISVTEHDYVRIQPGQPATLTIDALPGRRFDAAVKRIAPKFDESSRQARVELQVGNEAHVLRPGVFVRATLVLGGAAGATIVPEAALTRRDGREGVFVVGDDDRVTFRPVEVGIREGGRVQVRGEGVAGRVVTLGQQLLDDGSLIDPKAAGSGAVPDQTATRGR